MAIHTKLHAAQHTDGTDDIQSASSSQKGLMTASYAAKVESLSSINATAITASGTTAITLASGLTRLCDATTGDQTIQLPVASTVTGYIFHIKKVDSTVNTVTVQSDSGVSANIDGSLTAVLTSQYETLSVQSDGTNWWII